MVLQFVRRRARLAVAFLALSAFPVVPAAAQCLPPAPLPSNCPAPYIPPIVMPRAETPWC